MRMWAPICAQDTIDTIGSLTINNVLMHIDGAWNVLNPQVLWVPTDTRGANSVVSHASGRRKKPWHLDQSTYSLQLIIDGTKDWDGDPYTDPFEGLETNIEYLVQNVVLPPDEPLASYDAELIMPSGNVREGAVQPRPFAVPPDLSLGAFTTTMSVIVPGVRLQPAES